MKWKHVRWAFPSEIYSGAATQSADRSQDWLKAKEMARLANRPICFHWILRRCKLVWQKRYFLRSGWRLQNWLVNCGHPSAKIFWLWLKDNARIRDDWAERLIRLFGVNQILGETSAFIRPLAGAASFWHILGSNFSTGRHKKLIHRMPTPAFQNVILSGMTARIAQGRFPVLIYTFWFSTYWSFCVTYCKI